MEGSGDAVFPKAGNFDSRIASLHALQTDRTLDMALGKYQPQLESEERHGRKRGEKTRGPRK